jgi:F-type H+-transporting ATPase subunit c
MKIFSRVALAVLLLATFTGVALAQPGTPLPSTKLDADVQKQAVERNASSTPKYTGIGAGIGMGLAIVGAGVGIGLVGFAALSGIARQPEQAGTIRGTMILLAALVEGAALIAVVFCLVLALIAS